MPWGGECAQGPVTIAGDLDGCWQDAKRSSHLANLVECQRGVERLPEELLVARGFMGRMRAYQSLHLGLVVGTQ